MSTMALLGQATAAGSTTEVVLFVVFAGIAIGSGIAMVSLHNMVHGALMLVINLLAIAGLYLVLQSAFLSVVQMIVYAGAIMVLFLFVIMLLGVHRDDLLIDVSWSHRVFAMLGAAALIGVVAWGVIGPYTGPDSVCDPDADIVRTLETQPCVGMDAAIAATEQGTVEVIGMPLFTRWTFPFEVSALLLIVATIGAMLLGRRHDPDPDADQAWVPSMVLPDEPGAGDALAPDDVAPDADADESADAPDAAPPDHDDVLVRDDLEVVRADAARTPGATTEEGDR